MRGFRLSSYIFWFILLMACGTSEKSAEKSEVVTSSKKAPAIQVSGSGTNNDAEKLSSYGLFEAPMHLLKPTAGVVPYSLNSPLFSDYAFKKRFIKLPEGVSANYHATEVLEFPVGTILIKNFYYPADFREPEKNWQILETRLLIHEKGGWKALPYVWNDEQTEAYLEVAGATKEIVWNDGEGEKRELMYSVPNQNQCRSCHLLKDKIMPIGPSARQLNGDFNYAERSHNQLTYWKSIGLLDSLPDTDKLPKLVAYTNSAESLGDRARAYLEINCAHCHRPEGPAKNSALHLMASVENPAAWGIGKTPIAAGKGSGGLKYDIVPQHPEQSILVYRMKSTDPGIMMPELGRKLVHAEGLDLIKKWIKNMPERTVAQSEVGM